MGIRCSKRSSDPGFEGSDSPARLYSSTTCVNMEHHDPSDLVDISLQPYHTVTILYRKQFPDKTTGIRVDVSVGKHFIDCGGMTWDNVTKMVRGFCKSWVKNQKIQIQITDTRASRRYPTVLTVNFPDLNMQRSIILWAEIITGLRGTNSKIRQVPVVLREYIEEEEGAGRGTGLFDVAVCGEDNSWTYGRKVETKEICTYELSSVINGSINIQVVDGTKKRRGKKKKKKISKHHIVSEQPGLHPVIITPRGEKSKRNKKKKKKKKQKRTEKKQFETRPRSLSARGLRMQQPSSPLRHAFKPASPGRGKPASPGRKKRPSRPVSAQLPSREGNQPSRHKRVSWSESDGVLITTAGLEKKAEANKPKEEEDDDYSSSGSTTSTTTTPPSTTVTDSEEEEPRDEKKNKKKRTKTETETKETKTKTSPVPPLNLNEVVKD